MQENKSALIAYGRRILKRWGPFVARLRTLRGTKMVLRDRRGTRYRIAFGEPFYELAGVPPSRREFTDDPRMLAYLERVLVPGAIVVDIGASIGVVALLAGRLVGKRGRVVAVEAERVNFNQLTQNIALNRLSSVEAYHMAIADRVGTVTLNVFPRSHRGWHSIGQGESGVAPIGTAEVDCTTIDSFLKQLGIEQVDLLKIDIEGAEPEAFSGAVHALSRGSIRRILFEISHGPLVGMGHDNEDVVRPLDAAGYAIRAMAVDGGLVEIDAATISRTEFANLVALAPGIDS